MAEIMGKLGEISEKWGKVWGNTVESGGKLVKRKESWGEMRGK